MIGRAGPIVAVLALLMAMASLALALYQISLSTSSLRELEEKTLLLENSIMELRATMESLSSEQRATKRLLQRQLNLMLAQLEKERERIEDSLELLKEVEARVKEGVAGGLLSKARQEEELIIYGSPPLSRIMSEVWPRFLEDYPWAKLRYLEGSELLVKRFLKEVEEGEPSADLLWQDLRLLLPLVGKGLFLRPEGVTYRPLYPKGLLDPNGEWYATHGTVHVLAYNQKLVPVEHIPRDWRELSLRRWKGALAFEDPRLMGSSSLTFLGLLEGMDKNEWLRFMVLLASNGPQLTGSNLEAYRLLLGGKVKLALTSASALLDQAPHLPLRVAPVSPVSVEPIAVVINARGEHRALAQLWLDWVLSPKGQRALSLAQFTSFYSSPDMGRKLTNVLPYGTELRVFLDEDIVLNSQFWRSIFETIFG